MPARGTRGAYRKEDRVQLPQGLQKELVEKAAARFGNCQELAKHLNIPKSSVHYYRVGRLTMPVSVLEEMLRIANDEGLRGRIESKGVTKDRTWANEYSASIFREICREKVRTPTRFDLERNDQLRRRAAALVSYVLAEGSIWLQKEKWGEHAVNITFSDHEHDLYDHFRNLCKEVFGYDIGQAQQPGNGAKAVRGFIYSRFIAEWFVEQHVAPGDKSSMSLHLPNWVMDSKDRETWKAALQPWCDGEGCAGTSRPGQNPSFRIAQSRHTPISADVLPVPPSSLNPRLITRGVLDTQTIGGVSALEYAEKNCRSEVLDDVATLFKRLGFNPIMTVSRLALKDDGYWSCVWEIRFGVGDSRRLWERGLVVGENKTLRFRHARHI